MDPVKPPHWPASQKWPPDQEEFGAFRTTLATDRPAIFLSASVPAPKSFPDDPERQRTNDADNRTARPRAILTAVSYLARLAMQDYDLVFGAHPAISPMVLDVVRRFPSGRSRSVVCFQSKFFQVPQIPIPTWDLERDGHGRILWTPASSDVQPSLTVMREAMVSWPNLRAAVFIGGMDGLDEEAELFAREMKRQGQRPLRFAVASTGGAALRLFEQDQDGFAGDGSPAMKDLLRHGECYPDVVAAILDAL